MCVRVRACVRVCVYLGGTPKPRGLPPAVLPSPSAGQRPSPPSCGAAGRSGSWTPPPTGPEDRGQGDGGGVGGGGTMTTAVQKGSGEGGRKGRQEGREKKVFTKGEMNTFTFRYRALLSKVTYNKTFCQKKETTTHRCPYSKGVHRTKCQALRPNPISTPYPSPLF